MTPAISRNRLELVQDRCYNQGTKPEAQRGKNYRENCFITNSSAGYT